MDFKLESAYKPTGDQPEAIRQLTDGLQRGDAAQTLLGVTGSGKTFTIANVIANYNRPTLVLSHNKTLAAQLYGEFKSFFPNNAVEYFVSFYDYYQPEAYKPSTDTYIEKDLAINDEIDRLRLSATSALMSGRNDIIVVSSVSCIYGIGNPSDFTENTIDLKVGMEIKRDELMRRLVRAMYTRNEIELFRGNFRAKGDTVDIFLSHTDLIVRVMFWDDEIDAIETLDPVTMNTLEVLDQYRIVPAKVFVTTDDRIGSATSEMAVDLGTRVKEFEDMGRPLEARRLLERTNADIEMLKELKYCPGIENYSRYFDGRKVGEAPFCLIDFFPKDFLLVVDESHMTIPQIGGMYGGDRSRKVNLVEYGFRLPSALDNRPLKFDEFEGKVGKAIYVSATPAEYELDKSGGIVVEQVIRPTGLLDPEIEVRPTKNQIDDLLEEIVVRAGKEERVIVTTFTKKMAEELSEYLLNHGVRCTYIHSDIDTLERVQIIEDVRNGLYDVLVGVQLLREGIDLPQVSLVAILDADKEGYQRSYRALTQIAGRAARHLNGHVIMYADHITSSMRKTIEETDKRRMKQKQYNKEHNITPTALMKKGASPLASKSDVSQPTEKTYIQKPATQIAAEPGHKWSKADIEAAIARCKREMLRASKEMDFIQAAQYRDEMISLQSQLDKSK